MREHDGLVNIEFLKSLMIVKNLSEREFAELIGVSYPQINRVMNGKRGAGNKLILGVLNKFPEVRYEQLFSRAKELTKGNNSKKNRPA